MKFMKASAFTRSCYLQLSWNVIKPMDQIFSLLRCFAVEYMYIKESVIWMYIYIYIFFKRDKKKWSEGKRNQSII